MTETLKQPVPLTDVDGPGLTFDFPGLHIGTAEYAEGPTGATVFHFPERAVAAVDVRGGMPGAYNVDVLRLGYDFPFLDAITIAGGSWYGLQAAAGVAAALKDDDIRSGDWHNLANVAGAIVYDLGDRRLTEICPDAALGAAAFRAARSGRFPLGAQGAGRMVMQGHYYGLSLHSGQGGAYRELGRTKIAAFAVTNPLGVLVDRAGGIVTGGAPLPGVGSIHDLLGRLPLVRDAMGVAQPGQVGGPAGGSANPANTTISVVVTNQIMPLYAIQRMAYQVHGSMGRAIQPFATASDGDVLFAASTHAVENPDLHPMEVATLASEVMWEAILSAVTPRPYRPHDAGSRPGAGLEAEFIFARDVRMKVKVAGEITSFENTGARSIYGFAPGEKASAPLAADGSFAIDLTGRPLLVGIFLGQGSRLVLNPGSWEQTGWPA